MMKKMTAFLSNDEGSTPLEYALVAGIVAMGMSLPLGIVGDKVSSMLVDARIAMSKAMGAVVIVHADERNPNGSGDNRSPTGR